MSQPNLFETITDRAQARIDEVLLGRNCSVPPTDKQKEALRILRFRRGLGNPVKVGELGERLKLSPRSIKELIASLVMEFEIPIGASRDAVDGGYYIITSLAEGKLATQPYKSEIVALARRVRVLEGPQAVAELCGQIRIQIEENHEG